MLNYHRDNGPPRCALKVDIRKAYDTNRFERFSGLQVNKQKGVVFLTGVNDDVKYDLLNATGFSLGSFPLKYLGVPLISTRLSHSDYQPLLDKIMARIQSWTSR